MTKASAAAELLRRRWARRSLAVYSMERGYWPARHHMILIERLEAVARGECKRLMVFMPPGSAKSTYTSQLFPAWLMAQPSFTGMTWDILGCSNTSTLAEEFSARVRRHVRESGTLLGVALNDESQSVERWEVTGKGVYRAKGAGSAIAGQRADVGLIDDPIKGAEQADSETQRAKIWTWYTDDFRPRVKPQGAIVVVQTRWHEDDLSGRILPDTWDGESGLITARDGEEWSVVCMPQLATRDDDPLGRAIGEPLWPEWLSLEGCQQAQRSMSARSWSALHQQSPAPDQGGYFQREWLGSYSAVPVGSRAFLASDWATPSGTDWTAHVVVAVDTQNRLYVLDANRTRGTTAEAIDTMLDLCATHKVAGILQEKGVLWRMIEGQAVQRMKERNIYAPLTTYARTADKQVVARAIQGRASQGMLSLPEQAPWLADLEAELLRFPAAKHDDWVDCLALVGLHLDKVVAPPAMDMRPGTARTDYNLWDTSGAKRPHRERLTWPLN